VTVAGEIDLVTAPQLRDQVRTLPEGDIVLDISGVRLLAAAGLRVLLDLHDCRARAGAEVVLAGAPPSVQRVLCVTGLDQTLPMIATIEEAVAFVMVAIARDVGPNGCSAARCRTARHVVARALVPRITRRG
jgi:anti-anti-sigma factor